MQKLANVLLGVVTVLGLLVVYSALNHARANDPWGNSPYKGWAEKQVVVGEARGRFNCQPDSFCSCCDGAEIVHTSFRVDRATNKDTWWWLDGNTWRQVPADIIHYGERAPNGDPVLFVYLGTPRCFWIPDSGI